MDDQPEKFNPKQHITYLKGKPYLETRWRISWFRTDHPNGVISTEIVSFDPVVVKATVSDGDGGILATAHAGAVDKGNAVWSGRSIEKSETAAIGRALGHAGYGTQFSGVDEDGGQQRNQERANERPSQPPPATTTTYPPGDLRDKTTQDAFIERWHKEGMSGAEMAAALGVQKWSEWDKGVVKADEAVKYWLLVNVPASKKKAS